MSVLVPPYLNRMENKAKKDVIKAERAELRAKHDYEFAKEYTVLCKKQLNEIKNETVNVTKNENA